jgi:hypothetical protein
MQDSPFSKSWHHAAAAPFCRVVAPGATRPRRPPGKHSCQRPKRNLQKERYTTRRALQARRQHGEAEALSGDHADGQMCLAIGQKIADGAEFIDMVIHCVSPCVLMSRHGAATTSEEERNTILSYNG